MSFANHTSAATWIGHSKYGSIYYARDRFEGCEKAEMIGDVPEALRKEVQERVSIGPIAERDFWSKERSEMDIDRGPCACFSYGR